MTRSLLPLALLLLVPAGRAAGNPCAAARVDGRTLVTAEPQRRIRILDEQIRIHLTTEADEGMVYVKAKRFRIDYVFDNRGRAREVVMGFPVVVPRVALKGKAPLTGFSVRGDGVGARVGPDRGTYNRWTAQSALHWCERNALVYLRGRLNKRDRKAFRFQREAIHIFRRDEGAASKADPEEELIGWYFWRQRFRRGKTRVRIGYSMRSGGICRTTYVLRTGRLWGDGVIGRLRVTLSLDAPGRRKHFRAYVGTTTWRHTRILGKRPLKPTTVDSRSGRMTWRLGRFKADSDLVIENQPCGEG